ncbi:ABC transporter ATP-binding protein [Methylobacterium sp. NEAU 140]|uniref:ABC transporter ATP-binding protein n=1 Tax=Methylobacterium sp. NEAU 140 TaxID=3064945 RepID=UPI00273713BE|nr:ABC transporter ATP-binding protein [Methylobacterium sp. NEAU 140]MDP4026152.1 ABC transporter ATP-binding protein [Methylobacterium sp. NEAU 140]
MPLLKLSHLRVSHGRVEALSDVSLVVEAGEIVALLGANGAGKTTTLRTISGLMRPDAGDVAFEGRSLVGLSPEMIVRAGIAHVPEGRRIFSGLTARENVLLGAANRPNLSRHAREAEADEVSALFPEIASFRDTLAWKLSGGQLQMVAVARGLMAKPKLLILDEPSLGLAPLIIQRVFDIIVEIRRRGTTVLLVEQNANMALSIADRGYVLETGRIVTSGCAAALGKNEAIKAAYLGQRAA